MIAKKTYNFDGPSSMLVHINTTPLIDVMLVLLIMLIITIPVRLHSVDLNLPKKTSKLTVDKRNIVKINIDSFGNVKINNRLVDNRKDLKILLKNIAIQLPKKKVYIISHPKSIYADTARVLFEVRKAGISEIGFMDIVDI
ncbi:MAG: hypothetical protein CBD16_06045 [Betaproteobacteria bacterium TMED156]|nr:MAG: hypothetical protein CBD16_06045 [Betaproteobacteria bacterium TMED156]|tara:strand:- start:559 stop:981 length:423 start_codon:yes stop_codon:yes gene_type:complete